MVKLIILFRAGVRSQTDERYNDFLMSLEALPGLRKKAVCMVYGGTGGLMPYRVVIEAFFDDRAAMEEALTSPAGIASGQLLLDFAGPDAVALFADAMEQSFDENLPPDTR
jgi:uncharacterized protein (TIGR02118 family)